jgi:hypothetical protein
MIVEQEVHDFTQTRMGQQIDAIAATVSGSKCGGCGLTRLSVDKNGYLREYMPGHNSYGSKNSNYGKHHTEGTKQKIGLANSGEKSGSWKGDDVSCGALHRYMGKRIPKPDLCQFCNKHPPYDLANITLQYNRNPKNWRWLCRGCHLTYDYTIGVRKPNRTYRKNTYSCYACDSKATWVRKGVEIWHLNRGTDLVLCNNCFYRIIIDYHRTKYRRLNGLEVKEVLA